MKQYADLLERIVATGVQAAAGSVAADQLFDMGVDHWKLAAAAGFSASLVVVKQWAKKKLTARN